MKFWVGVLASLLVFSPRAEPGTVQYQTIVREIEVKPQPAETPVIDSMISDEEWVEIERQSLCLYNYLKDNQIEITLHNVWHVGEYTDIMGGACYLTGEDDVPVE